MFDQRIIREDASPLDISGHLEPVGSMLAALQDCVAASIGSAASHNENHAATRQSLAARYAGANAITRRRFDALLREAETASAVGLRLLLDRAARSDTGTCAAAHFLGRSLAASVQRLENLLPPQAA